MVATVTVEEAQVPLTVVEVVAIMVSPAHKLRMGFIMGCWLAVIVIVL
jgi:hypothetical protein